MNKNSIFWMLTALVLVLFLGFGQGLAQVAKGEKPFELRWGTTGPGGTWQPLGNAFLEDIKKANPNITGTCLPGNTTVNVMGVKTGKFNIGVGSSDNTVLAWNGEDQFASVGKVRNIRNIASDLFTACHIVVRTGSNIHKIEDLRGKRISVGAKGASSTTTFKWILEQYQMSYNDVNNQFLSFADAGDQFIDYHLDCLAFTTVPPPFAPIINVVSQRKVRFLSIPEDKMKTITQKYPGVNSWAIPPGTYQGQDYPVRGTSTRFHVFVSEDMPDWVVYSIVKTIVENLGTYQKIVSGMRFVKQEDIAADIGIPFHPAAVKYYKEVGLIK
jgi:TRAP transporter TAXI family solute receptor